MQPYANGNKNQQHQKHGQTLSLSLQWSTQEKKKQNKFTAKQYKANAMEEQAEATEELIANLTESHTCQMEILIKNITEALKEMMALVKSENKPPTNNNGMS
jgi:hypothetical protein